MTQVMSIYAKVNAVQLWLRPLSAPYNPAHGQGEQR